jgi:hypothetical protein
MGTVDWTSLPKRRGETLYSGGGGGTSDGMEPRIAKLEASVSHLERDVGELRVDMKDVRDRLTKIEATVAGLPTKGFVFSVYGIISALLASIILFQHQIQALLGVLPPTP